MSPGPQVSSLLFHVKVFLLAGTALGLFFHFVTRENMPWWPDTAMIAAFMGGMAVLIVGARQRDRRANQRLRNAARMTRAWWTTRNSV